MFFNYQLIKKSKEMHEAQLKRHSNYINKDEIMCQTCNIKLKKWNKRCHSQSFAHLLNVSYL